MNTFIDKKEEKIFDYNQPIDKFIIRISTEYPATYGNQAVFKLIHDSNKKLKRVSPRLDRGDVSINDNIFIENKTSFCDKKNKFRITNIRTNQNFDYFTLMFFERITNRFGNLRHINATYYCVKKQNLIDHPGIKLNAMNGTEQSNANNQVIPQATSFKKDDLEWIFQGINCLNGTSYQDLLDFIGKQYQNLNPPHISVAIKDSKRKVVKKEPVKINFEYNGIVFSEKSNNKAFYSLINYITPEVAQKYIRKGILSNQKGKCTVIPIGNGYYLSNTIGKKDLDVAINSLVTNGFKIITHIINN
jgi:hypothetical protein